MFLVKEKIKLKDLLAEYGELKEFAAGSMIFNYNEPADKIYFILKGLVRIYLTTPAEEIEVYRSQAGSFVGKTALVAENYSSQALAHFDTKVLAFKISDFKLIIKQDNNFANKLINQLCLYLNKLENRENIVLPEIPIVKNNAAAKQAKDEAAQIPEKKIITQAIKNNKTGFYLPGHKQYSKQAEKNYNNYLYEKEIKCPVCSHQFKIKKLRNSRIRVVKVRTDLRPIYQEFDIYYYNIDSCPNCLFSARKNDFELFSKSKRNKIKANFKEIVSNTLGQEFKINYSEPRQINEVLDAHYLAIKMYNYIDFDLDKKAFLWRELSWIYEDLAENDLASRASQKALSCLEEFYFLTNNSNSKTEAANLELLLAVLYSKHGQKDKALTLLDDLVRDQNINNRQKNKARDLFLDLKTELKNN